MTPASRTFLQSLLARDVVVSLTAPGTAREALHYKAPTGTLTKVDRDALRQHKPALLALVEWWEERASLMEYDGGLPRDEAERQAWACVLEQPAGRGQS